MLHYFAKSFFAPILVSPRLKLSGDLDVYLLNDRFVPIIDGKIFINVYKFSTLEPVTTLNYTANVAALSSEKQFSLDTWDIESKDEIFMRFFITIDGVVSSPYNYLFPVSFKNIKGLQEPKIQVSTFMYMYIVRSNTYITAYIYYNSKQYNMTTLLSSVRRTTRPAKRNAKAPLPFIEAVPIKVCGPAT